MHPAPGDVVTVDPSLLRPEVSTRRVLGPDATIAERMEESQILSWAVAAFGIGYLFFYFGKSGFGQRRTTGHHVQGRTVGGLP
jgi:short-chain fatty acids transporter